MIYSRDAFPLWVLARLQRGRARKMFFEAHTAPTSLPGRWLRRRLAADLGGFVMVTDHLRQRHEEMGIRPARCIVAHDGVRIERFAIGDDRAAARSRLRWPQAAFMVGYLGRTRTLGMDKGLTVLIRAAEALRRDDVRRPVQAVIAGPSESEVQDIVSREGHSGLPGVIAPGWVEPDDAPLVLRAVDVCVLPLPWTEHFAYEASPMKLFEYMASGTPIVATDLPALREVLRDGENALLIPPSDVSALAGALRRLRNDPGLGERLARQAAIDVRSYAWETRARRILELMMEIR